MRWITSAFTEVELPRAVRAVAPEGLPEVPTALARLNRFEIDSVIRSIAAAYPDAALRPLDAVHLATAQAARATAPLAAMIAYDKCLIAAASALGLPVVSPGKAALLTDLWVRSGLEAPVGGRRG